MLQGIRLHELRRDCRLLACTGACGMHGVVARQPVTVNITQYPAGRMTLP